MWPLLGSLACAAVSTVAAATEYYSWIDTSGTAVLTDDPGHIPPASERSSVTVYRYHDRPSLPTSSLNAANRSPSDSDGQSSSGNGMAEWMNPTQIAAINRPDESDAPDVLLDLPPAALHPGYVWMPLQDPFLSSSGRLGGFWWRSGARAPMDAFNAARFQLPGQGLRIPGARGRHKAGRFPNESAVPSGNAVYDQVVRERHALQQSFRGTLIGPRSMGPAMCCGQGRAGIGAPGSVR